MSTPPCWWLVVAFESDFRDKREYLEVEYAGLQLHIHSSMDEFADLIAVFVEPPNTIENASLTINRFLSAMAWKDRKRYITLSGFATGAGIIHKDTPRFNFRQHRQGAQGTISRLDFEHLQTLTEARQKLALALFREGLGANNEFYRLLSYFKILNILFRDGKGQSDWVNANLGKISNGQSLDRLHELQAKGCNIGDYLRKEGRNAVAHAFSRPIRDPDVPADLSTVEKDANLMQGVAEVIIEEELGVPSLRKIWREHLYELAEFKALFGEGLTMRLKDREDVPKTDFPAIPPLTINLKEKPEYEGLRGLQFRVESCRSGIVTLVTDCVMQPARIVVLLDFPRETLDLSVNALSVDRSHASYTTTIEASLYRFLIDYFRNGVLQVFDAISERRLSHKTAFLPLNIDVYAIVRRWQDRIVALETKDHE